MRNRHWNLFTGLLLALTLSPATPAEPAGLPRCRVTPLPNQQASFTIDGRERLRWHFGPQYPRPFLYPLIGPAGSPLTRMGHPGAPNHDHHRSIWFAHADVEGIDFWSDNTRSRVRQKQWLVYEDGAEEAVMAVLLGWNDGDGEELLEQELVVAVRPLAGDEVEIELQSTFRPGKRKETELRQTNFGFLAVRLAKSISTHFGGGDITNSEGAQGERLLFGQPARWMDYSGPVPTVNGSKQGGQEVNGVTCFDHPGNPGYPSRWHVREDGWMGASVCRTRAIGVTKENPLVLRYLLHAHRGGIDAGIANAMALRFGESAAFEVSRSTQPHREHEVKRIPE